MSKPKNRIAKYFLSDETQGPDKFELVEFEKFDPTIIQNVVQEPEGDNEIDFDEEKTGGRTLISQDSQLLRTIKLWIGNTKVNLSPAIPDRLVKIEGVESFDTISRYRFRVGIGKMFDENVVKKKIAATLKKYQKSAESRKAIRNKNSQDNV